jgi:uncharacterized protein YifE (UPF0438 family)
MDIKKEIKHIFIGHFREKLKANNAVENVWKKYWKKALKKENYISLFIYLKQYLYLSYDKRWH